MKESDIIDVLDTLGVQNIMTNGEWVNASCPYAPYVAEHNFGADNNPSFGVHIEDNGISVINCLACGRAWPITKMINDLSIHHKADYTQLVSMVRKAELSQSVDFGHVKRKNHKIINPLPLPIDENLFNQRFKPVTVSKDAIRYLKARKIDRYAAIKADLRWDEYEKRVTLPIRHHDGKLYGYSGRSILNPEDYPPPHNGKTYPKIRDKIKKAHFILGIEHFTDKPIFVVEGLFSYLHMMSVGADKIFDIACVFGATLSDAQASLLVQYQRPVYLMYDNDRAGDAAMFGKVNDAGEYDNTGAIGKLYNKVPILLPEWPMWNYYEWKDGQGYNVPKIDIDELTLAELKNIRDNTLRYEE